MTKGVVKRLRQAAYFRRKAFSYDIDRVQLDRATNKGVAVPWDRSVVAVGVWAIAAYGHFSAWVSRWRDKRIRRPSGQGGNDHEGRDEKA